MSFLIKKLPMEQMDHVLAFLEEVFAGEQNIPAALNNISEDLKPIWWYAEYESEMAGVIAGWIENDAWHLGRFAVSRELRGLGIGKQLITFALTEIFKHGAEDIITEARDVSVAILKKLGGKVTGGPINFYGEPVTPMIIEKEAFFESVSESKERNKEQEQKNEPNCRG